MLIETIKKKFKRVDEGECLGKCDKKIVKDVKNPELFIIACNSCKRIIFEKGNKLPL
jgi:hypothetical protein